MCRCIMQHAKVAPELVGVIGPAPYTLDPIEFVVFNMDELVLQSPKQIESNSFPIKYHAWMILFFLKKN